MAHFRGTLQGHRGEASRLGTKKSGLTATADGWTGGVKVNLWHDPKTGRDYATVTLTDGSAYDGGNVTVYCGPVDALGREDLALRLRRAGWGG